MGKECTPCPFLCKVRKKSLHYCVEDPSLRVGMNNMYTHEYLADTPVRHYGCTVISTVREISLHSGVGVYSNNVLAHGY